tara:strand:- start:119 stop:1006 length:888 start_codon:yes stop_codon:yes gene_type:complete
MTLTLLLCAATASASSLAAERERPLLRCRGGNTQWSSSGGYRAYPSSVRRQASPAVPRSPFAEPEDKMSDAERVYVVQQFSQQVVRKRFLKRVYGILAVQLAATAGLAVSIRATPALLHLLLRLQPLLFIVAMGALFWLGLSESARKEAPLNGVLLALFTLAQGSLVGLATMRFPAAIVLRAAGATALATTSLSAYALQTKRDFTPFGGMLSAGLIGLMGLLLMQAIFGGSWLHFGQTFFGVLLFCGYIVYNTQLMMGGGKARQLRPDEHIMAAVSLYTDIINLFLYLLRSMEDK